MKKYFMLMSLTLAAGCGEVVAERTSTVDYLGDTYTVRTQTIQTANRTYDVSRIKVGAVSATCLVDSPGSCRAAVADASRRLK